MLDVTAFSDALLHGNVSFLQSLGAHPFRRGDMDTVVEYTGDDAVVYPLGTEGNQPTWALRLPLDYQTGKSWPARYAEFASATGAIAAHLPNGITLLDVDDVADVHVALLHQWIPGQTLSARVARVKDRTDRDRLADLLWPLADIGEALRGGGMVHGDIAPGNIVLRPDGTMILIDLDRGGFQGGDAVPSPRRRPGYRLPRGGGSPIEEDAFALLVLMTSCSILADTDIPLDLGHAGEETHPSLVFSSWDLMDPQRSRLVREIESRLTPMSVRLLALLIAACGGHPDRTPGLLRDAVQEVRRSGPAPAPADEDSATTFKTWGTDAHLAKDVALATPAPGKPEAEMGADEESPDRFADSWWPTQPGARQKEPLPDPESPAGRSVAEIVTEIQGAIPCEPVDAGNRRRKARMERRRHQVSEDLQRALVSNDREVLVRLAMSGSLAELGDSDRDELMRVVRALSHDSISRAISRDDDGMIVAAVDDSAFRRDEDLDPAFRDRVRLARKREHWSDELLDAVRELRPGDVAALMDRAPEGAILRLPESVREQAERLSERETAANDARDALRTGDADRLAQALGRLVTVQPIWADHIAVQEVVALLGEPQIEQRLVARFAQGELGPEDQWMVDVIIARGRLPEATRLSGLSSWEVGRLIYKDVGIAD